MKYIEFLFFRINVVIFAITPFRLLYFYSDILNFFLFNVIKYRKKVVLKNLHSSFPEKSETEINNLAKNFYKHLSDITLESIKGMSISEKELKKRYKINNIEILDNYYKEGKSLLCLTSHYGNWEYGILGTGFLSHEFIALYLPLTNKYSEKYGVKRRSRFGTRMVSIRDSKEVFSEESNRPKAFILAADQSPSNKEKSYVFTFLNQESYCLHGPEAYARKTNYPAVFFEIKKVKRGYYELNIEKFIDDYSSLNDGEITYKYIKRVEENILQKPEFWLWSHRRWKLNN